ncbi:hypothetical protein [Companilactobacillus nantensis]|uniref:Uncharacterized protein n=1 Tax=Companilactobacillus nantensis DSM 16982 TaxID=1423774 RepID=A0A0R1WAJ7_9LACO|nr:hypothetical protein [Companilactobacillus nantensis]KRM14913.1 hypothetical protein FD31_GL001449 [Companilactobacillus nantensis DSM 16982]GEO64971.1 hypothetical protein LNA01_21540 [Companilactobacillus nantensis]
MTILINKKINLNEDSDTFIQQYIEYLQDVNPKDLYEGLSNKQILKNKFIFKINQLENLDLVNVDLHITNNVIYVLARFWNSKIINVGAIPLTKSLKMALAQDSYPTLAIDGGNCKKVVTDENGEDTIIDYFEPYQLTLQIHKAEPVNCNVEKIDTLYHRTFKSEQSLITISKNLMRCFAVFGLLLGLGFMFLGFFLTGLMVIIAFFGVNSYTLLLADTHMQTQQQRVNS